ncbi:terminase [Salmonella enterica]|nr:terminase [Salmonella enterica]EBI0350916.1 terminase [Salmonella enterica subsp. arizonae serovar 48:z4,z23,z32:-]EBM5794796.1 terminase [Salmonella enterica]EBS9963208.1 terminase [Salmonella enterica]EDZ6957537.1 terminase [Salmonella enterica]
MSLFRDHQRRVEAAQAMAAGNVEAANNAPNSLHLLVTALAVDVQRLRSLSQIGQRIVMKRDELLPRWMPYVREYLDGDAVHLHSVFSYCVIWLFDVEDFSLALDWADIAIEQQQETPANIRSDFPHFVADTILAWAEREADNGRAVEPYFSRVSQRVLEEWPVNEIVKAKYLRFSGLQLLRGKDGRPLASAIDDDAQLAKADMFLAAAQDMYPQIQVRTLRDKIAQRRRKLTL